ncbi:condensation domain-containing protein [Micromonospora sp. WMMD712]|uniref:condensation domain-containing protein n=1 Tax=Micromonospora sp. WMMD712 TaxID=3016096 RepID=UPI00249C9099|nr:condensation domain-containing protein [Micromonospora sp. WMMD712]WFE58705.1 condensation domain-containing protein [Micromonospora sp. WMMD712]
MDTRAPGSARETEIPRADFPQNGHPAADSPECAPLSLAQERLWLIDAAAPGAATYLVPVLLRWQGRVDPAVLGVALTAVVARHEPLRTGYRLRGDEPEQFVGPAADVPVRVVRAPGGSWADVEDEVRRLCAEPLDLATGQVLRCVAFTGLTGGDAVLLVLHHIAFDGWSMGRLCADLATAYAAGVDGRPPRLPAVGVRFAELARRDREAGSRPDTRAAVTDRAAELLAAGPGLTLAGALPAAPGRAVERAGGEVVTALPAGLWDRATALAAEHRVTPFVLFGTAFQVLLSLWSGRDTFRYGVIAANRPGPEADDVVGFFVNTVPLRAALGGADDFAQLCAQARGEAFRTLLYQRLPYHRLTAAARAELVEVAFALQNFPVPGPEVPVRWALPEVLPNGTAKFDLMLTVEERADGWYARWEHDLARYPRPVVTALAEAYLGLLGAVTERYAVPLAELARYGPDPAWATTAAPDATTPTPATAGAAPVPEAALRRAAECFAVALADLVDEPPEAVAAGLTPTADFFALGGHSLLVVTMLRRIERQDGTVLSAREFLADPTVAGLARLLAAPPRVAAAPPTGSDGRQATSPAQQRFWSVDRLPWLRQAYLVPTVVDLAGGVDVERLRAAVGTVLARHPALRARFELDRRQRRVYHRTDGPAGDVTVVDAADWTDEQAREAVAEWSWTGFDLARAAPARAHLLDRGGRGVTLVVVVHHIVFDGWSRQLLLRQIAAAYRGEDLPEPVAGTGHTDPDDAAQADTRAVVEALTGAPVDVALPYDRGRGDTQETRAGRLTYDLDPTRADRLRKVAADAGCTMFMVSAALLAVALARVGGQRDFLFAFPWSQRTGARSADAVGLFIDTLVLRADTSGEPTWQELLARVRDAANLSFRHSAAPFDAVAAALHPDRDLGRPPVTPVYLSAADGELEPPDLGPDVTATVRPLDPLHLKYELELTVVDRRQDLRWELLYSAALFDPATAHAVLHAVTAAADDLIRQPTARPLEGH